MAGGGSSDPAAAAAAAASAPNLQIGAAPRSSAPPVLAPPAPGRRGVYSFSLAPASLRVVRGGGRRGRNGNGPARGGVPKSPPVQQPVLVAPAVPAATCTTTAALYCFICDDTDHDMSQCQALKVPRPSATLRGYGCGKSAVLQIPDSVWRADLAPPVAVVKVTGGKLAASVVEAEIARIAPVVRSPWRWEAIPHGDDAFLVSFPSSEDLRRVTNYEVRLKSHGVALDFSEWKGEEIIAADVHVVWVHVQGVHHSLRHFLGLWAVGSVVGSTQGAGRGPALPAPPRRRSRSGRGAQQGGLPSEHSYRGDEQRLCVAVLPREGRLRARCRFRAQGLVS